MLPNFIVGGTSAGGTSFVVNAMIQHPDIYLPKQMRPEPHYFYKSWEYEKPISYYQEKYFSAVENEKAVGERSSSYLFSRESAQRISKHLPDIKLIFTLRNPIERTYANYRYTVLEGLEELSFEEALRDEKERVKNQEGIWAEIQPYNYTGRGFYGEQLEAYLEFFSPEQILLLKSESISDEPYNHLEKIFRFLDVDPTFKPELPPDFTSFNVKDRTLQVKLRKYFGSERFDKVIEAIRKNEDPLRYIDEKNQLEDKNNILSMQDNLTGKKQPMSDESRSYLSDLFANDMRKLNRYIDFSIDDWR